MSKKNRPPAGNVVPPSFMPPMSNAELARAHDEYEASPDAGRKFGEKPAALERWELIFTAPISFNADKRSAVQKPLPNVHVTAPTWAGSYLECEVHGDTVRIPYSSIRVAFKLREPSE